MKTQLNRWAGRRAFDSVLPTAATILLLAALPTVASTNQVVAVLDPAVGSGGFQRVYRLATPLVP